MVLWYFCTGVIIRLYFSLPNQILGRPARTQQRVVPRQAVTPSSCWIKIQIQWEWGECHCCLPQDAIAHYMPAKVCGTQVINLHKCRSLSDLQSFSARRILGFQKLYLFLYHLDGKANKLEVSVPGTGKRRWTPWGSKVLLLLPPAPVPQLAALPSSPVHTRSLLSLVQAGKGK